uniref:Fe2OG dioxygenase domain-containing protein n=1 Tax=Tetradesmus obliquus TaxID=3088 RepID=A0A383V9R5_TETOB|eukprot:jgi/Sobl393_1/19213/SZX61512.1
MASMQTISIAGPSDMGSAFGFGSIGGLGGMGSILSLLNLGLNRPGAQQPNTSGTQMPALDDALGGELLLGAAAEAADLLLDLQEDMAAGADASEEWQNVAMADDVEHQQQRWVEEISVKPHVFLHHNFLSTEEADHLIGLAEPYLAKPHTNSTDSNPPSGAWVQRGQDKMVARIEERIADWMGAPIENGEPMHVLRYQQGEQYKEHFDYFNEIDSANVANGGQRVATVLLYLSDVDAGGETVFPLSVHRQAVEEAKQHSDCAKGGVAVKPRKGDAVLFFSVLPDVKTMDKLSLHAGCPVLQGEKWVATKWLRMREWVDAPLSQLAAVKHERQMMRMRELQAMLEATGEQSKV